MRACMWQGTVLNIKFKSLWLTGLSLLFSWTTSPVAYPSVLFSHWTIYPLWWWLLCVNLAGLWDSDIWSNIILDVSVRCFWMRLTFKWVPGVSCGKESTCNAGDLSLIPGLGKSYGVGNGNPLHYSCLENSMDRGAWSPTVNGVTKSQTWLSN